MSEGDNVDGGNVDSDEKAKEDQHSPALPESSTELKLNLPWQLSESNC